ncbi:uncharacterized protein LOC114560079 [Perca flavescens]|uniref:uncharacterized protein LOC114560079 n=1 Tax=Perca flavescens TaxID=8167 RepID=UPI00106E36BF|nr:uncharacterized protein LOC114560079 [Perca flavescens]
MANCKFGRTALDFTGSTICRDRRRLPAGFAAFPVGLSPFTEPLSWSSWLKVGQGAWPGNPPTCTAAGYPAISFCSAVADSLITAAVFRPGWNLSLAPDRYSYQSDLHHSNLCLRLLCRQPFAPHTFHLLVWIPPSSPPPVPADVVATTVRETPVTSPEPFTGELDKCWGFLLQCALIFQQRPLSFTTESSKVHYTLGLLRGRALAWAEAVCTNQHLAGLTFTDFSSPLKTVFDHPDHAGNSSQWLINLRQGTGSVADYSVDFWTLAADSKWDEEALQVVFVNP